MCGAARLSAAVGLALAVGEMMMLKGEPLERAASSVALLLLGGVEDEDMAAREREGDMEGTLQR